MKVGRKRCLGGALGSGEALSKSPTSVAAPGAKRILSRVKHANFFSAAPKLSNSWGARGSGGALIKTTKPSSLRVP